MKEEITLKNNLKKKINSRTHWLTGPARSGTSIIGKILASFKDTEYFYEPDLLVSLFALKKKIRNDHWLILFQTYFYFDLVKNGFNKRRVNLNFNDKGSYYFNYKKKDDLKKIKNFNIFNDTKNLKKNIIVKLPGYLDQIYSLKKKHKFKIYYVERDPLSVINSIYKKKWWSDNKKSNILLVKKDGKTYPDWLKNRDYKFWNSLNEFERSALYIVYLKRSLKNKKNIEILNYDQLTKNPKEFVSNLKKITKLKPTEKTFQIIKTIKIRKNNNEWIKDRLRLKIKNLLKLA